MKMLPKQKAKQLCNIFEDLVMFDYRGDKKPIFEYQVECALIVVNEIKKNHKEY